MTKKTKKIIVIGFIVYELWSSLMYFLPYKSAFFLPALSLLTNFAVLIVNIKKNGKSEISDKTVKFYIWGTRFFQVSVLLILFLPSCKIEFEEDFCFKTTVISLSVKAFVYILYEILEELKFEKSPIISRGGGHLF